MVAAGFVQQMYVFAHFWGHNILVSWQIGHGVFGFIEGISVMGAAILRFRPRSEHRERWEDYTMKVAVILLLGSFLVSVFFVAPFIQYENKPTPLQLAQSTPPPVRLDVHEHGVDEESRNRLKELEGKFDPLNKPITTAQFTLLITFQDRKDTLGLSIGSGAFAALAVGKSALLSASTAEHISDADGHARAVMDCPFDAPYMGKPVKSLTAAEYIQLEFADGFVPINTDIASGQVVLVINNEVKLIFDIPPQKVTDKLDGQPGLILRDIKKGLEPLTKQLSPTPNKEASPP